MTKILVVDDDDGLRLSVKSALLAEGGFEVDEAMDGEHAVARVKQSQYRVVILDVDMPHMTGLEALKEIKAHDPSIIVLIMTAYANIEDAVKAVKDGAFHYVAKPVRNDELIRMLNRALSAFSMVSDAAASAPTLMESGRRIIGETIQMQKVFNVIMRLSKVDTPVLIRGASGTGKELVARAIHHNSIFKDGKFVAINCSAIPENLFESELFGHEKGSFTGADQRKIGKFQYAEGGTLFLDELGDLPVMMQVKLLRVLQERRFTPVGANREIESNVRIIAATNRPLEAMIKDGSFREDLFYRLNVMPIFLPALAERKDDVARLIQLFVQKFNKSQGKKILGPSPDALGALKKYDWPGNIRELENVIEHAFILEESLHIQLSSLPESILAAVGIDMSSVEQKEYLGEGQANSEADDLNSPETGDSQTLESNGILNLDSSNLDFNRQKEAFEKEFIVKALQMFKGRINQTALHANIPKKTLLRKIEKYGIVARDYAAKD